MSAPFSSGGAIILREPQTVTTGNGTFYVSNMVAGIYTCRVSTPITPTTFTLPVPDTNGVVNAYQLVTNGLPSILLTNLFLGNTLWVDRANGNDSSAARNDLVHRFQSMGAAKTNAIAGDTVVVLPGTYVGNNYAKSNVNWYLQNVTLTNRVTSNGIASAYGFWDDRAPGAAGPMTISGSAELFFCGNNDSPIGNVNIMGAIVFTNLISNPVITVKKIGVSHRATCYGVNVTGLASGVIRVTEKIFSLGELFSNYDDPDPQIVTYSADLSGGIYWKQGELFTECPFIFSDAYSIWADEPVYGVTNNWTHKGVQCVSSNTYTTIYFTSITNGSSGFRLWLDPVTEIAGINPVGLYGSGKVYIRSQKIGGLAGQISPTIDLYGPPYTWIETEKISSYNRWLSVTADSTSSFSTNEVHITAQHYEANSATAGGFLIGGGTRGKVIIHGGQAESGSNAPVLFTQAGGGETQLKGLTLDASISRGTNSVMILSSNGVVLQGASLIAPPAATTAVSTNNSGIPILEVRGTAFLNKPAGSTIIQSNGLLQASTGLTMANALNLTAGLSVTGSFITNGTLIWYQTNNTPTLALPNGSLATITDGRFYVRTNGAWVQK